MYNLITKLICWKNFVNLRDFYLINLWNFLLGGLGWSSRTVKSYAWFLTSSQKIDCVSDTIIEKTHSVHLKLKSRKNYHNLDFTPSSASSSSVLRQKQGWRGGGGGVGRGYFTPPSTFASSVQSQ